MARVPIAEFGIIQMGLAGATVAVYYADSSGASTGVLAPLYLDPTTAAQTQNPQVLDENGKLQQLCYVDDVVVAAISNITPANQRSIMKSRVNPLEYPLHVTSAEISTAIIADSLTAAQQAAASAAAALVSQNTTVGAATATAANVIQTGNDVISTHADVVLTHADVVTANSAAATATAAAAAAAAIQTALVGTSTSAVTVGTGNKAFVTQAGKTFLNQEVIISSAAAPTSYMHGMVIAYAGTGLTVNVNDIGVAGTHSDWIISVSGTQGPQGAQGNPGIQGPPGQSGAGTGDMLAAQNLSDVDDVATARINLGLGTMAIQAANNVTITGGNIGSLTTPMAVADGGTGGGTAAAARTGLGLVIGTNVQAFDSELSALASVTSGADLLFYFTGSGTGATIGFNSVARTFISQTTQALMRTTGLGSTTVGDAVFIAASAAVARTTLGLTIGSDVQAYDAELAALASLTSAANKIPYFTGSGTAATLTLDTDGTLAADSDTSVPTQKAVKTYVDANGGGLTAAAKSDMETATSVAVAVTPAVQQNHPGHPKAWGFVTYAAGVPTLVASYNIAGITDIGLGILGVTIAVDFSSANYCVIANSDDSTSPCFSYISSRAAGSFRINTKFASSVSSGGGAGGSINAYATSADPEAIYFACYGDQ